MDKLHKYDYQINMNSQMAPAKVVRMVGENKRVLEIGAGPGSITKLLKSVGNCRITALEIDSEAIKKLGPYCEKIYQADLNHAEWVSGIKQEGQFEVVVAADVLEHVYEPLSVLTAMKDFLTEDGYIVISLPHIGHSAIHACLLQEDFEYRDWGLLDRTHIRFFGIKNIQALFEKAGLKIIYAEYVVRSPEETEFAERWASLPEGIRHALSSNPFGTVYQVVLKAVPVERDGQAISLLNVPVEGGGNGSAAVARENWQIRPIVRRLIPARVRAALRSIASRLGVTL